MPTRLIQFIEEQEKDKWKPLSFEEMQAIHQKTLDKQRKQAKKLAAKGKAIAEQRAKDYATESNDNTWFDHPLTYKKPKNPHLQQRAIDGAKQHAAWEQEHPVLSQWGNVLGAAPFAVAALPAVAAAAPAVTTVGDAVAATKAGQAITAGLTPLMTAANTSIAGAPALTWANVGLQSMMTAHGLSEVKNGTFTPMTAFELTPLTPAVIRAPGIVNNLRPQNIRNHWYVAKPPIGYTGIRDAAERWVRGIASGKKADIDNPWWYNSNSAKELQSYAYVPDAVQGAEREQYLQQFGEHALEARADAWRMHNLIPQKYNTFTSNSRHPGSFTDMEGIKRLKYLPPQVEGRAQVDFVNSVGGNVGVPVITNLGNGIPDTGTQIKRFGVTTTSDWFDLHPFSRESDLLSKRLFPTFIRERFPKLLEKLDNWGKTIEAGDITGGKPFLVQYDIPFTSNVRFTSEAPGVVTEQIPGFVSENLLPQSVFNWERGMPTELPNINLENNFDFLNYKFTKRK